MSFTEGLHDCFAAQSNPPAGSPSRVDRSDCLPSSSRASRIAPFPSAEALDMPNMTRNRASSSNRARLRIRRQPKRSAKNRYADPPSRANRTRSTPDRRGRSASHPSCSPNHGDLKSVLRKSGRRQRSKGNRTPKTVHFNMPSSAEDSTSSTSSLTELSTNDGVPMHGVSPSSLNPSERLPTPEHSISSGVWAVEADHNDPTAMILLEAEGRFFRVHEWFLAHHSDFFKGLLAIATTANSLTEPIGTECSALGLRTLLAFLYSSVLPPLRDLPTVDLLRLLALVSRWEVTAVVDCIDEEVTARVKHRPWESFAAASWIPNIAVGKEALRHMADDFRFAQGDRQCEPTASYCRRDISASWTTELMNLWIKVPRIPPPVLLWVDDAPVFGKTERTAAPARSLDCVAHFNSQNSDARRNRYQVPDWLEIARRFSPSSA